MEVTLFFIYLSFFFLNFSICFSVKITISFLIIVSIELLEFPSLSTSEPVTVKIPLTSIKNFIFILTIPAGLLGKPFNCTLPKMLLYLTKLLSPS